MTYDPPGRRSALIALLLLIPAPTIGTVMAMMTHQGPVGQAVYMASKIWILALPLIWIRFVEGQPLRGPRLTARGLGAGVLSGIVISVLIFLAYFTVAPHLLDATTLREAAQNNGIGTPARYIGLAIYLSFVNAMLEEYVWRWFVYRQFTALTSGRLAVVLAGLAFTLHHVFALWAQMAPLPALLCSAGVLIGGLTWSTLYRLYRSIWPGYVSHAIIDVVILTLGYLLIFRSA